MSLFNELRNLDGNKLVAAFEPVRAAFATSDTPAGAEAGEALMLDFLQDFPAFSELAIAVKEDFEGNRSKEEVDALVFGMGFVACALHAYAKTETPEA